MKNGAKRCEQTPYMAAMTDLQSERLQGIRRPDLDGRSQKFGFSFLEHLVIICLHMLIWYCHYSIVLRFKHTNIIKYYVILT